MATNLISTWRAEKMKEEYLEALRANMDIFIIRLDVCHIFESIDNLTDSTICNTEETGDFYE